MAEQNTPVVNTTQEVKKGKSPLVWIGLACGGCLLLSCCVMSIIGILCVSSEDFKDSFTESYCDSLEEQNLDPSEDPLQLCE